jgi:sulfur carrier protein ThiS adenylyltransferase
MVGDINRYDRQELIEGWNQEKLSDASIGLVGSGHIINFLGSSLTALGIGDIRMYDDDIIDYEILGNDYYQREFLLSRMKTGLSKVECLEKRLKKINPYVNINGMQMSLDNISEGFIGDHDIMIVAINEVEKVELYRKYALKKNLCCYNVKSNDNGAFFTKNFRLKNKIKGKQEGVFSGIVAGLLVGEIVRDLMYGDGIEKLEYSSLSDRFKLGGKVNPSTFEKNRILMVGAGALGNSSGIGLANTNLGSLYIVDDDKIETTNLNRQILFYDAVGKNKAEVLSERLNEINPNMKIEPIRARVKEDFLKSLKKINPEVILDCVDNLDTRAVLNYFALKNDIALVSGGTDYRAGQVVVYQPGKSKCLDCRLGVNKALKKERNSRSCIYSPLPSVITTNEIIGKLMVGETRCVLKPKNYGEPVRKMIKYDSSNSMRIGLVGGEKSCLCKAIGSFKKFID